MIDKIKTSLSAAKKVAKRDIGIFFVMSILGFAGLLIALPVMWILIILPDWCVYLIGITLVIWIFFGDSIMAGLKAFRGKP